MALTKQISPRSLLSSSIHFNNLLPTYIFTPQPYLPLHHKVTILPVRRNLMSFIHISCGRQGRNAFYGPDKHRRNGPLLAFASTPTATATSTHFSIGAMERFYVYRGVSSETKEFRPSSSPAEIATSTDQYIRHHSSKELLDPVSGLGRDTYLQLCTPMRGKLIHSIQRTILTLSRLPTY